MHPLWILQQSTSVKDYFVSTPWAGPWLSGPQELTWSENQTRQHLVPDSRMSRSILVIPALPFHIMLRSHESHLFSTAMRTMFIFFGMLFTLSNAETLVNIFKVLPCRFRRDIISNIENNGQFTTSRNLGYQVTNLTTGSTYRLQYVVGAEKSNILEVSTRQVKDPNQIDSGLPARSGAMVVITVILSVSMFILLVALIVTVAHSLGGD
ncbi:uroplakin-2 isoform X2 [Oncorhynchus mykiss]|uniref:uroplakin-2 isoform X2 n=1 Tax=Oncorhynchus mykiss TaxID=8022 RepID=UPI0018780255|nr:uroplakin-2 isoform X2 [Oncorhynchus mykiss]